MYVTPNAGIVSAVIIRKQQSKGQLNIFTQPILLILLISIFAIFVIKTLEVNVHIAREAEEYDFKSKSIPIFNEVMNCISCDTSRHPYLISASKLNQFNEDFINNEAPCIRDEKLGWSAVVKDIASPGSKSWHLGEPEDSKMYGLKHEYAFTLPVAIRYEDGSVRAGELNLNLRHGDLESVVGMIEKVHKMGSQMGKSASASMTIRLNYPLRMTEANGRTSICIVTDGDNFCRTLSFSTIEFEQIDAGNQYIVFKYNQNTKLLRVIN